MPLDERPESAECPGDDRVVGSAVQTHQHPTDFACQIVKKPRRETLDAGGDNHVVFGFPSEFVEDRGFAYA